GNSGKASPTSGPRRPDGSMERSLQRGDLEAVPFGCGDELLLLMEGQVRGLMEGQVRGRKCPRCRRPPTGPGEVLEPGGGQQDEEVGLLGVDPEPVLLAAGPEDEVPGGRRAGVVT